MDCQRRTPLEQLKEHSKEYPFLAQILGAAFLSLVAASVCLLIGIRHFEPTEAILLTVAGAAAGAVAGYFVAEAMLAAICAILLLIYPQDWRMTPVSVCVAALLVVYHMLRNGLELRDAIFPFGIYLIGTQMVLGAGFDVYCRIRSRRDRH